MVTCTYVNLLGKRGIKVTLENNVETRGNANRFLTRLNKWLCCNSIIALFRMLKSKLI